MNDRDKYAVRSGVILSSIIALYLCIASYAIASHTIEKLYGDCSVTTVYLGYITSHTRGYQQKFFWSGGYVEDIQWYLTSRVGDPSGIQWIIMTDNDGLPDQPVKGGSIAVDILPAWYGIGGIGSLTPGDYWIGLTAENANDNGDYFGINASGDDCVSSYGYRVIYDGEPQAVIANEIRLHVYENFATPTATFAASGGTAVPTLTPTITLTPTPILSIITTLESGAGVAIERTSTYGDRAIVIAICVLIVIMLVDVTTRIIYAKRNN